MAQADDFTEAKQVAEQAVQAMDRHEVPPTPENYAVWYAYASGLVPELTRTIDILVSNKQFFSSATNAELYDRFCDTGRRFNLLQETGDRLQYVVDQMVRYIDSATDDANAFRATLDDYSITLGTTEGGDKLRAVISGLILQTQRMAERNRSLEDRLTRSSGEIQELRENLEVVRREVFTDALTGIPNRKFFETRFREAARDAMENDEQLCLLILDIDHFKQFNDSYGHQIGDQVLRLVARTLTDCVKGRDTPARYGGEEFAIVLPQTRLKDAIGLADQIRQTMMRRRVVRKDTGADYGTITLSIGAAVYRPGETLVDTVRRADAALYHAKRTGRNRVASEEMIDESEVDARAS